MNWKIKEKAEDFKVTELPNIDFNNDTKNEFLIFKLTKKNYSQTKSLRVISGYFNIHRKEIGFSGIKDKYAITEQYISIRKSKINNIDDEKLKIGFKKEFDSDLKIELIGSLDDNLYPGKLYGNNFEITIRNINKLSIEKFKDIEGTNIKIPNYFGEQRFGKNNFEVGLSIIKRDYKKAVKLIKNSGINKNESMINRYYKGNNEIEVLKKFPKRFFKLYLHSVQSKIFNDILASSINDKIIYEKVYLGNFNIDERLPLVGHDTENDLALDIMEKYELMPFDFINKQITSATLHEIMRNSFVETKIEVTSYSLEENSLSFKFDLKKGSYATEAIEAIKGRVK
ncbi:MAG: tRNA pseudouridine(13) synthase TruD [Candidatus Woesearchaeota archaeon]